MSRGPFDSIEIIRDRAYAEGYRAGQERMREVAARILFKLEGNQNAVGVLKTLLIEDPPQEKRDG